MALTVVFDFLRNNKQLKNMRIDSRQIQAGDIFIAIPGFTTDGRKYIGQAIANGAGAIIVEAGTVVEPNVTNVPIISVNNLKQHLSEVAAFYYQHPSQKLKVIGITGTNGKTSTSHYIAQLFAAANEKCGVMGTLGNGILPNLVSAGLTTSDCCTVQQELSSLAASNAKYVVMEVSSVGLDQGRLLHTEIDTAVFTNLSQDHLDCHKDMTEYFNAKCKLFTNFALKNAVINLDDAKAPELLNIIPVSVRVITYSLFDPTADIYVDGSQIFTPWGTGVLQTNLLGSFNTSNVLAAIACCALQGLPLDTILHFARNLYPVCGRMELIQSRRANAPRVIVDYAHTPDALIKVLQTLREYQPHTLFCVFGCGGDRDRSKRPLMARAVLENSDQAVITSDNPRTEDPQQIVQDMLDGITLATNIIIELDRAKAITQTIACATANDIVLIAGKGHEDYQIIGTTKLSFSDQIVAQQALGENDEHSVLTNL